jgi:hypothetical protein
MKYQRIAVFVLAGFLFGGLALTANAVTIKPMTIKKTTVKVAPKKPVVLVPRKIDGVWVPKGTENQWPVAVMIDNHTAARPQSGLQSASIVYETLAEGGIPRYMAVFADANVKAVGPVRSTRPYFVRFAAEINAAMAHAGGSPDGLKLVTKLKMFSLEGIKGKFAKLFYRAYGGGVHGLYTNVAALYKALKVTNLGKVKPLYQNWKFGDSAVLAQRPNGKHGATIDFSYGQSYVAEYRYDKKQDKYLRYTGGKQLIDRQTKKQVVVRNVIIVNVPKEKVLDRQGRLDINVIGRGTGYLLKGGKVINIAWSKKNDRARTIFTDTKTKQEVVLTRGNTWIEIVPKGHKYKVY